MKGTDLTNIEKIIEYKFTKKELLVTAFTHSSYANINHTTSNERLEFLGDTVLSTIISERIYFDMDYNEGQLSKLRSKIVSMRPLALLIENLGLINYLRYSGSSNRANITDNMKADLMEAIIGAIYIDGGFDEAKSFVKKKFFPLIVEMEKLEVLEDSKSYLQEMLKNESIKYTTNKTGSDHNPIFTATVVINGVAMGKGVGGSKRQAEKLAASEALKKLTKV
ncbi:MAG: ribonuclease III [Clostridia bacterium]|nr:ribonuclease III [Clostridia bacterium]